MAYKVFAPLEVLDAAEVNDYLMKQAVIVCTSGTRPSSPPEGMTIYETDTDSYRVWNGAAWRRTGGADWETAGHGFLSEGTTVGSITSTSPAAGSPVCGATFVSPPSGGVYITVSGRIIQTSNTNEVLLGFEVRSGGSIGAGTVQVSASSARALTCGRAINSGAAAVINASRRYKINTGTLTAGSTFNVQTMHWVTGGTGTVEHREILVEPVL